MGRLRWAMVALLVIPLADALLLVFVAGVIGWPETVLLVVLTALLGMLLVRAEGRHTVAQLQRAIAQGETPTPHLVDGALLLVAGAFLLTPGLVTDAIGVLFALPPTRFFVREALRRFVISPYLEDKTGGFVSGEVYTFGFPEDGAAGPGADARDPGGDAYDLGPDAYDVDADDEPASGDGRGGRGDRNA